ncbi:MAG TPA: ESX secretion-associated protein EspG [Actinophytocola sp.]|uniref:ESX secretion-associated protein EspG n=1 Tax=Actinophytocola sp. TaxID=1872138 RepID=UPI002DDD44B3|nr:ESX secretion-associated protein EspG [Actinophytocola sp.]HEV2780696.1 ESX secretion-associated protein EspG [Actinophytocola sp.]
MTMGIDRGEVFHPVEVELLCAFAEVEAPFPLEVPSSGETEVERSVMFAGASDLLTERGLADENGPLGLADDFVYLLRNATGVLDLVLAKERLVFGAAVLTYRDEALLVTQDVTDPDRMMRMKAVTLDDAVEDLIRLIPALPASVSAPFNVPRRAVQDAFEVLRGRMPAAEDPAADPSDMDTTTEIRVPKPLSREEIDELLRAHGIDEAVARRMVTHLQPVLGNGQAGVAKRDDSEDQWHRAGEELRWLDTQRGRFRLAEDGEWISVNPFTEDELRAGLRRLASAIRS